MLKFEDLKNDDYFVFVRPDDKPVPILKKVERGYLCMNDGLGVVDPDDFDEPELMHRPIQILDVDGCGIKGEYQ